MRMINSLLVRMIRSRDSAVSITTGYETTERLEFESW
jgi:hypothetical protein